MLLARLPYCQRILWVQAVDACRLHWHWLDAQHVGTGMAGEPYNITFGQLRAQYPPPSVCRMRGSCTSVRLMSLICACCARAEGEKRGPGHESTAASARITQALNLFAAHTGPEHLSGQACKHMPRLLRAERAGALCSKPPCKPPAGQAIKCG